MTESFVFLRFWRLTLGWFVVAGAMGVLLRAMLVGYLPGLTYPFLVHAHSHVVLLGWLFNALLLSLLAEFGPENFTPGYRRLWWGFQVAVLGMLLFFPVQGYAAGSILFSTLHVFLSYALAWKLRADLRTDASLSARLLRWGLVFLVLSTLGPYAVGALKARGMQETPWYPMSIYFYLHFLYNGWFQFGVLALAVRGLERAGRGFAEPTGGRVLGALVASCFGTFGLSALWAGPPGWVWVLSGAAALLQAGAVGALLRKFRQHRALWSAPHTPWAGRLVALAGVAFGLKIALQVLSALPWAAAWAYAQRHLVIAYLHLVFIGVLTFFLLGLAFRRGALRPLGLGLLVVGFGGSEAALVLQSLVQAGGGSLPYFGEGLLGLSVGMWVGVALLWGRQVVSGKGR